MLDGTRTKRTVYVAAARSPDGDAPEGPLGAAHDTREAAEAALAPGQAVFVGQMVLSLAPDARPALRSGGPGAWDTPSGELDPEALALVRAVIVGIFAMPEERLVPEASFADHLGMDSIDMLEMCQAVEERCGFEIPYEEEEALLRVGDLAALVQRRRPLPA